MTKSASYYFWLIIALGGIFLAVFLIALWNAMPFAAIGWHAMLGHISDFCERLNKTNKLALYGITIGFFLSASVIFYALARIFLATAKTLAISREAVKSKAINKKIARAIKSSGLKLSDIKITESGQTPFCAGFLRPKILISNDFIEKLNAGELTAVLLHEKQHLKSLDVLKTIAVRFFCSLLFFLPAVKILAKKYYLSSELEADSLASAGFKYKAPLLSAMGKIYENRSFFSQAPGIVSAMDLRLGFLLNLEDFPKISLTKKQILSSLLFLAFFAAIFLGSFHFNHALSVEVVKYYEGQMTPVAWNQISFFNSSNLYLTPINQTKNPRTKFGAGTSITQCAGQAVNFSHL